MKIGKTIIEEGINLKLNLKRKKRKTVRAVVLNDQNEVLMIYSEVFNDYTFPGGGVKPKEKRKETLKRELAEETGAKGIEIIKKIGHTMEIKYSIGGSNNIYEQKSYYYLCSVEEFREPRLMGREIHQGLKTVFVDIEKAIKHNNKINESRDADGMQTVLIRENIVLNKVRGMLK